MDPIKALLARTTAVRDRGTRIFNKSLNTRLAFTAQSDETLIDLYDEIGFYGITAAAMREKLNSITTPSIRLRINSPGGDVFDGLAMYNDFKDHPATVNVEVVGLAASAASIIAMAGDTVSMADNAFLMIHNAWTVAYGDKHIMEEMSGLLGQIDGALAATYAKRTGLSVKAINTMMDAETWLGADEARAKGFADAASASVTEGDANALFDLSIFSRVPSALKRQIENGLRDAGFSRQDAKAATAEGFDKLGQRDVGRHDEQRDVAHAETVAEMKSLVEGTVRLLRTAPAD